MSHFFPLYIQQRLAISQTIFDTGNFRVVLFRTAPANFDTGPWTAARTVAELVAYTGWQEMGAILDYPLSTLLPIGTYTVAGSKYVLISPDYVFTELDGAVPVEAIGFEFQGTIGTVTNPLVWVTNTPTGRSTNLNPKDALTSVKDTSVGLPPASNQWLFGWATAVQGGQTAIIPTEGPVALFPGAPLFETSNTLHVWLYPQRANMIANPSFELAGTNFWATNGTLTRVHNKALEAKGSVATSAALLTLNPVPVVGDVYQTSNDGHLWQYIGPDPNNNITKWSDLGVPTTGAWAGQFADASASYVKLDGSAGCYIQGPDLPLGGAQKITIEFDAALADWTPTGVQTYVNQASGSVNSGFSLQVGASGQDYFNASDIGTTLVQYASSVAHVLTDNTRHVVGGTWIADNGDNSTYQPRVDGANLGTLQTGARFADGLYNSTRNVEIGRYGDDSQRVIGNVYGLRIYVDDVIVASPDFTSMAPGQTSLTDSQGNVWTLKGNANLLNASPTVVESNVWPTRLGELDSEQWSFQLMAKGSGHLKVGLIFWDSDYAFTGSDWGEEETWTLSPFTWTRIACVRHGPQAHTAMMRLETTGNITIDQVLAERGVLKDLPYFDGDELYAAPDSYSWYGGSQQRGKSYSMWYSGRRSVIGRLFATPLVTNEPGDIVTDEDVREAGMVYNWVPAGVTVIPHLDVFYPNDLRTPPPTKVATVTPYYETTNYLNVGRSPNKYVTTPDFAAASITGDCVVKAKVRRNDFESALNETIVSHMGSAVGNYGWRMWWNAAGNLLFEATNDGTTFTFTHTIATLNQCQALWNDNEDFYVGVQIDVLTSTTTFQGITSVDGFNWTTVGTLGTYSGITFFNSTGLLQVGSQVDGTVHFFDGRVYWTEMRSGLDPNAGTVLWRFDAEEYTGTTTSYTDPRGRVWTFNGAGALVPKTLMGVLNPWV
jgi:hypothetical protein